MTDDLWILVVGIALICVSGLTSCVELPRSYSRGEILNGIGGVADERTDNRGNISVPRSRSVDRVQEVNEKSTHKPGQ